jgi:hypothetical protein
MQCIIGEWRRRCQCCICPIRISTLTSDLTPPAFTPDIYPLPGYVLSSNESMIDDVWEEQGSHCVCLSVSLTLFLSDPRWRFLDHIWHYISSVVYIFKATVRVGSESNALWLPLLTLPFQRICCQHTRWCTIEFGLGGGEQQCGNVGSNHDIAAWRHWTQRQSLSHACH